MYFVQIISETQTSSTIRNTHFYKTRTLDEGLVQWHSGLSACCIHIMTWVPTPSTQVKKVQWCTCNPRTGRADRGTPGAHWAASLTKPIVSSSVRDSVSKCSSENNSKRHSKLTSGFHTCVHIHTYHTHTCAHVRPLTHTEYLINPWNS